MLPPRRSTRAVAALTFSVAGLAAAVPAGAPAFAPAPVAPQVATGECLSKAKPNKPTPISSTKVTEVQGRVDIRGAVKLNKRRSIGPLVVKGCASGIQPLVSRTYVLVKAPKSNRYLVALTRWTTATGAAGKAAAPTFRTEAAFTAAAAPMPQVLTIRGIRGSVYGPIGSPIALLARTASGKPYTAKAKVALAANYIATGGYAAGPGL